MRRTSKIILITVLVAVMLLGVGYAAIQNITLNITGTAKADPSQANFVVKFAETTEVSDASKVTASVTDDTNATINVEGLTAAGETVTATYTVQNTSDDLSADLSVATTNNNEEYFEIDAELGKPSLVAGEATTLVVTVELLKTPITAEETATIGIQLTAVPVQPGEEGTSGGGSTGSTETTTLASITTANIGDYINLRNNIVGTEATTDDWRILYVEGDTVYAVLADYLPNSTNYASNAGLDTMGTYGVYSNKNRDTLLTALTTNSNWNGLANGISGATVIGSPTAELTINSYYAKTGIQLESIGEVQLDSTIDDYDLYVPMPSVDEFFFGFWIASPYEEFGSSTWIHGLSILGEGMLEGYDNPYLAIRPVVALPTNTTVTQEGEIWTIPVEATNGETNGRVEKEETTEPIETTLATVTNANIGEYIDLGNNIVGGEATTDDWRILYVEEGQEGDAGKVYAILADYLPNSTNYAANSGLDVTSEWSVYSNTNRDTLLNGLTTTSNWQGLANGISEEKATVTGSPTVELLMKSYNTKNGTSVDYTAFPTLDATYLYVPHFLVRDDRYSYRLASPYESNPGSVWLVDYYGVVGYNDYWSKHFNGLRPVVCLSSDINVVKNGNLWTVAN